MKSQTLIAAVSGILLFAGLNAVAQNQATDAPVAPLLKIATVDMQELFTQYHRTNEAQNQINVERARIQKDNNERLARIRGLETNLGNLKKQLDDPSLNDSKKQTLFNEWQMQQQEHIALERERSEFLTRRTAALNETMVVKMNGIMEVIRKKVEAYAKAGGYNLVVDKGGQNTSKVSLVIFSDIEDLTAVLLVELKKDAHAEDSEEKPAQADAIPPETSR